MTSLSKKNKNDTVNNDLPVTNDNELIKVNNKTNSENINELLELELENQASNNRKIENGNNSPNNLDSSIMIPKMLAQNNKLGIFAQFFEMKSNIEKLLEKTEKIKHKLNYVFDKVYPFYKFYVSEIIDHINNNISNSYFNLNLDKIYGKVDKFLINKKILELADKGFFNILKISSKVYKIPAPINKESITIAMNIINEIYKEVQKSTNNTFNNIYNEIKGVYKQPKPQSGGSINNKYEYIINPSNNRKISIHSPLGHMILKKYVKYNY